MFGLRKEQRMRSVLSRRVFAAILCAALLLVAFVDTGFARQTHRRHHHSRRRGALVGGAAGAVGGALVGGRKGAVIGAGAVGGTWYLGQRFMIIQHHIRKRFLILQLGVNQS